MPPDRPPPPPRRALPAATRARVRVERRPEVPREPDRGERPDHGEPQPLRDAAALAAQRPRPRSADEQASASPIAASHATATTARGRRPSDVAYAAAMAGGTTRATATSAPRTGTGLVPGDRPDLADQPDRASADAVAPMMAATQASVGAQVCVSTMTASAPSAHRCGTQSETSGAGHRTG